jgi:hypothetical protein
VPRLRQFRVGSHCSQASFQAANADNAVRSQAKKIPSEVYSIEAVARAGRASFKPGIAIAGCQTM